MQKINAIELVVAAVLDLCQRVAPGELHDNPFNYLPALEVTQAEFSYALLTACLKQGMQPSQVRHLFPVRGEVFSPERVGRVFEAVLSQRDLIINRQTQHKELQDSLSRMSHDFSTELRDAKRFNALQGDQDLDGTLKELDEGKYLPRLRRFGALSQMSSELHGAMTEAFHGLPKDRLKPVIRAFQLQAGLLPDPFQGRELTCLVNLLAEISQI